MSAPRPLPVLTYAAVAAASLYPVWGHLTAGWPLSHEGPAFAQRLVIYATHLAHGDPFPLWSSVDNFGFGSPMPLMYHKLFYLLAAPIYLLTRSVTFALIATLIIVLVVGAAGMGRLLTDLGASRLAATIGGCSLIVANYTVTDWLVRGAVAECTAAMLVPWVLAGFVRALRTGALSPSTGAWLGLLWLSHSVLAYYLALLLVATYLIMAVCRLAPYSVLDPRTLWRPLAIFIACVLPYLVPLRLVAPAYDIGRMLTPPFRPEDQMRPLRWYFWDTHWSFGHTVSGLTLQLDLVMLAVVAVGAFALARRHTEPGQPDALRTARPLLPVALVFGLALLLQLRVSLPIYHAIPGALFIQFPWRLLGIMTPALIACALYLGDQGLRGEVRVFVLGAAAAAMVAGSGAFVPIDDPRISIEHVGLKQFSFSGFDEYVPTNASPRATVDAALRDRWQAAGCSIQRLTPEDVEVRILEFNAICSRSGSVPLPLYASPLHEVVNSRFARRQRCGVIADMPSLCATTVPAGDSLITVTLPSFRSLLRAWR